jgi:hypothetical protein
VLLSTKKKYFDKVRDQLAQMCSVKPFLQLFGAAVQFERPCPQAGTAASGGFAAALVPNQMTWAKK